MIFQQDSVVLWSLNGNLKYHSIPLNGTKNPKYHSKYHSKNHSDTIQIPVAIIPYRTIQVPFKKHLNGNWMIFFVRGNTSYLWTSLLSVYIHTCSSWFLLTGTFFHAHDVFLVTFLPLPTSILTNFPFSKHTSLLHKSLIIIISHKFANSYCMRLESVEQM